VHLHKIEWLWFNNSSSQLFVSKERLEYILIHTEQTLVIQASVCGKREA
jgi:hypothetical protein